MKESGDRQLWRQATDKAQRDTSGGIGTLGEKTLHKTVKYYLEQDASRHEIPYLGFVADIQNAQGVTEIQTRSFDRLRRKLKVFLPAGPVRLACPLPQVKYVQWLDADTGQVTSRRKSPLTSQPWHLFRELDRIRAYLTHPNLRLLLLLLEVDEYRLLNGWSRDRKRGSTRLERIPLSLLGQISLGGEEGWGELIPPELPREFTLKELQKAGRLSEKQAAAGIRVLRELGLCQRQDRRGRAYLYRLTGLT